MFQYIHNYVDKHLLNRNEVEREEKHRDAAVDLKSGQQG